MGQFTWKVLLAPVVWVGGVGAVCTQSAECAVANTCTDCRWGTPRLRFSLRGTVVCALIAAIGCDATASVAYVARTAIACVRTAGATTHAP
jgi:hypothetical protein